MKICDTVNSKLYKNDRAILHSDCNCFYASVECLLNPNIRDLPVAVSGDAENRHGIILAKNEEAKKYNIKTGEAIWQAKKKCPQLLTVPARLDVYKKFSDKVRRIYSLLMKRGLTFQKTIKMTHSPLPRRFHSV